MVSITWLSFTSHNNNHKVLIHFFVVVEISSTRDPFSPPGASPSESVANPAPCLVSEVL